MKLLENTTSIIDVKQGKLGPRSLHTLYIHVVEASPFPVDNNWLLSKDL